MNVGFGIVRNIVIHDVPDALHIESAGGHIGGNHDVDLTRFEPRHGSLAQRLRNVAIERRGREAAGFEFFGQFHCGLLCAGKHQHAVEWFSLENPRQCIELVHAADHPISLPDIGRGAGLALDGDFDRSTQMFGRDAPDRRGNRRGEKRDLALRRGLFQDAFDCIDKAHAQHLVSFIEHQQGQPREFQGAAVHVIDDPSRCTHHHVHAAP